MKVYAYSYNILQVHICLVIYPVCLLQLSSFSKVSMLSSRWCDICEIPLLSLASSSLIHQGCWVCHLILEAPSRTNSLPVLVRHLLYLTLHSGLRVAPTLTDNKKQTALPSWSLRLSQRFTVWHVGSMVKIRPAPKANIPSTLDKRKPLLNPYYSNDYTGMSFGDNICISSYSLLLFCPLSHHHSSTCVAPLIMLPQLSTTTCKWPA